MIRKILPTAVKIAVSATILYALFRNVNLADFWRTLASVNPFTIVLIVFLYIGLQGVSAYRWSVILKKDIDISYLRLLSIYFIGMFFNNFLPTMVGGDIVKGYFLYRYSKRGDLSVASVFMDRYAGFTALMVITSIVLLSGYTLISGTGLPAFFAMLIGGFILASLVIWVGPLHTWAMKLMARVHFYGINKKIDTLYKVLMGYKKHYRILVKIFICSVVVQCGVIIGYSVLAKALGMNVKISYFFLFIPLTTAAGMLPVSLSGLGLREGAFIFLFSKIGATREQALSLSLTWFAISVIVSLIGGIEYIRLGEKKGKADLPSDL